MDGSVAIEANRQALKRLVAMLVDMAGLATDPHPEAQVEGEARKIIPRILWRAILALLRPAESAARRLIIATARGLVVPPPTLRPRKPKPNTMEPQLRRFGIAVMVSSRFAEGKSIVPVARWKASERRDAASAAGTRPRLSTFPLFDPPRRLAPCGQRRHTVPAHAAPRIFVPGLTEPAHLPPPPSPDDFVSAVHLCQRVTALAAALDDLPGQARRFARWKASRDAMSAQEGKSDLVLGHRRSPLRRGRPPGGRLSRYDPSTAHPPNIREVDEILAHAHSLAVYALENPDTS